jgi:hypothetical protein
MSTTIPHPLAYWPRWLIARERARQRKVRTMVGAMTVFERASHTVGDFGPVVRSTWRG